MRRNSPSSSRILFLTWPSMSLLSAAGISRRDGSGNGHTDNTQWHGGDLFVSLGRGTNVSRPDPHGACGENATLADWERNAKTSLFEQRCIAYHGTKLLRGGIILSSFEERQSPARRLRGRLGGSVGVRPRGA